MSCFCGLRRSVRPVAKADKLSNPSNGEQMGCRLMMLKLPVCILINQPGYTPNALSIAQTEPLIIVKNNGIEINVASFLCKLHITLTDFIVRQSQIIFCILMNILDVFPGRTRCSKLALYLPQWHSCDHRKCLRSALFLCF